MHFLSVNYKLFLLLIVSKVLAFIKGLVLTVSIGALHVLDISSSSHVEVQPTEADVEASTVGNYIELKHLNVFEAIIDISINHFIVTFPPLNFVLNRVSGKKKDPRPQ